MIEVHKVYYEGKKRYVVFDSEDYKLFTKEEIDRAAILYLESKEKE